MGLKFKPFSGKDKNVGRLFKALFLTISFAKCDSNRVSRSFFRAHSRKMSVKCKGELFTHQNSKTL